MNYAGHEILRAEVAEVANVMCDLRTTMNEWSGGTALMLTSCRNVWCVRRCFAQTAS